MIEQIDGFPIRIVGHDPRPPHYANCSLRSNRGG
jgi:hypothetical protein